MRKQTIRCLVALVFLIASIGTQTSVLAAQPTPIEPMYIGISRMNPTVRISNSGVISCEDTVSLKKGYTADVVWKLYGGTRNSLEPIFTWRKSGGTSLPLYAERDAVRGNTYKLETSVTVYDSNKKVVETVTKESPTASY